MDQNVTRSYHDQDPTTTPRTPTRPPPPTLAFQSTHQPTYQGSSTPFASPQANPPPVYNYQSQTPPFAGDGPNNRYRDTENVDDTFNTFSDTNIRLNFIRKVYAILSVQLLITFGFVLIFQLSSGSRVWAYNNQGWVWVAFIFGFGSLISLACCEGLRRSFPTNFVCLGVFTLCQSFMLGMVTAFYDTQVVWIAVLITLIIVIGLTAFSFQTTYDFTVCNGFVFISLLVLFTFGLMSIWIPALQVFYSALGALLFSFYLIVDTQMIVGGNHKNNISPEEYIFAAITLYTDILNIFLFILDLVQRASR